jgi:hypothetical protein
MNSDSSDEDTDPLNIGIYLHPNNPYVKPYIHTSIIIYDGKPVISDNETIIIPKQYISLAIKLEENSCYVRLIIIFDAICNSIYCYNLYGTIYVTINSILVFITLCSTYTYSKIGMRIYIYYQYIIFMLKCALIVYMIYLSHNNTFYSTLHINKSTHIYYIISGQCFITVIQIPFLIYLRKYYNSIPNILYFPNNTIML